MYTNMNKGKVFVGFIITTICLTFAFIIILTVRILSEISFSDLANIFPSSYVLGKQDTNYFLVTKVVDGDTIKVLDNGNELTVRLIGIDTPEIKTKECKAVEAKNFLDSIVLNRYVILEPDSSQADKDRYNRELRYVFLGNKNINQLMIEKGFAKEYTYNKDYKYKIEFTYSEYIAENKLLGIWSNECLTL
jgi:endonuclease YncB( thermonuclease family)